MELTSLVVIYISDYIIDINVTIIRSLPWWPPQVLNSWDIAIHMYLMMMDFIVYIYMLDTTLCDHVCRWLASGRWFSAVSSTNKTDHHDITEILLKRVLNTITLTLIYICGVMVNIANSNAVDREFEPRSGHIKFVFAALRSKIKNWLFQS
jgi:hypothetical protein